MMCELCQQTDHCSGVRDVPRGTVMAVRVYVWELMHVHLLTRTIDPRSGRTDGSPAAA